VDANKFFGDVSKIPIVGEFIISCAIYFILSLISATTDGFGLDPKHQSLFQYLFLSIAIAYFSGALSFRIWKYFKQKQQDNDEF
jgi:hypothetical protein